MRWNVAYPISVQDRGRDVGGDHAAVSVDRLIGHEERRRDAHGGRGSDEHDRRAHRAYQQGGGQAQPC
jgi:hypothetical protein